jgi:hypothetical protein
MSHGPSKAAKLARKSETEVWPALQSLAARWGIGAE